MQNKMENNSNHKNKPVGKDKKKIPSISFSNPETLKDLPDNPDVKYSRNKILYGEFIKKSKSNL